MQIVTDSGVDISPEQMSGLDIPIHVVPLVVTLEGKSYREGVDLEPDEFYRLLAATDSLPTTSQPSAGDFADTYRRLAATDPDILSIHMSSGLSGTFNSAQTGAEMVPEANITLVDTKTLSAAPGWQIEAAARALKAGWDKEKILALMERINAATDSIYTLTRPKVPDPRRAHQPHERAGRLNAEHQATDRGGERGRYLRPTRPEADVQTRSSRVG